MMIMKFLRGVKGFTRSLTELAIKTFKINSVCVNISETITDHNEKWKEHVEKMSDKRLCKQTLKYK